MRSRYVVFTLATFLFQFFLVSYASAVKYPEPVGYVNDFAKIIPAEVKQRLESELGQYEKQTAIEIAVVTVSSLEGLTVEDYTIGLAQKWGVGKKGKDNGVVFLVAPSERKMRIEVGYGLEPDLSDSKAGDIIQNSIIPFFKAGKMPGGVVSGVRGIITTLGDKPFADRVRERQELAEKKRAEDAMAWENFKNSALFAGIAIAVMALLAFVAWLIYLPIKKRKERELAERESRGLLKNLPGEIEKAEDVISHKDVTDTTKRLLRNAKAQYESGKKIAGDSPTDWVLAFAALVAASALLSDAKRYASYDKSAAEEARRPKPKVVATPRRSSQSSASSWSSYGSGSSSSSDSSFGSSFGGFGGGGFGGGGASGSW